MMARHGWNRRRALGALVASAAVVLGLASVSVQSFAAMSEQDAASAGDLVVEAHPLPTEFVDMSPGESRYWSIQASLLDAERGSLALRVFGAGELVEHSRYPLTVAVEGCDGTLIGDDPRRHPVCDGATFAPVIAEQPLVGISSNPVEDQADDVWTLPDIVRDQSRSFVVTLAVPADGSDDESLMGLRGEIGVGLFAAGEDAAQPEPPVGEGPPPGVENPTQSNDLATTGGLLPVSLLLIAAGTIGLGLTLGRVNNARRRRS
jgi:hypothetical protein